MNAGFVGMVTSLLSEDPVSVLLVFQIEVNDCENKLALNRKRQRAILFLSNDMLVSLIKCVFQICPCMSNVKIICCEY